MLSWNGRGTQGESSGQFRPRIVASGYCDDYVAVVKIASFLFACMMVLLSLSLSSIIIFHCECLGY